MKKLLAGLLILLCSCKEWGPVNFPELYRERGIQVQKVHIDPGFTEEERKYIIEGAEEWSIGTGGMIHWDYQPWINICDKNLLKIGNCSKHLIIYRTDSSEQISKNNSDAAGWAKREKDKCGVSTIYLVVDKIYQTRVDIMKTAAVHEIGHVLGLGHRDSLSIMTPMLEIRLRRPTHTDFRDLYFVIKNDQ